ncbi:MAG: histidine kinase [Sphaerochaeta sp.]|nr:histidine kinase [Sphaerochaeta sp.]
MGRRISIESKHLFRFVLGVLFFLVFFLRYRMMDPPLLLVFLLVVFSLMLRWRFSFSPAWMLIDASLLTMLSLSLPEATLLLSLYLFYFASHRNLLFCIPFAVYLVVVLQGLDLLVPLFSLLLGALVGVWELERMQLIKEADEYRMRTHHLEAETEHLLLDYADAQYLSRLQEREQIAQILHDSLGHELTAAHLSVKALDMLLERGDVEKAKVSQEKIEQRLSSALAQLKLAVRQLEPDEKQVERSIARLFEEFVYPVQYTIRGDVALVPPALQQILHSAIKEALTNVAKHANPTKVSASLDCNSTLVQLTMENDGIMGQKSSSTGNGLRYLRRRVERLGGSMSIQKGEQFKLLISIPVRGEMGL